MTDFHFIRPYWLFAIFILLAALYLLKKLQIRQSGWDNILPAHLAKFVLSHNTQQAGISKNSQHFSLIKPFIIGMLTILALAGPTWQKLPQPVFQVAKGSVLIMDMSYSMYATDLLPNRLTRARYKAIDLLNSLKEGDVGLIAYAGDAFIISPLTEDVNNIKLLLPSLSPDIMPELGSNPLPALTMADQMLRNAGHAQGDIYWLTDGIDNEDISDINQWSKNNPHRLNILGIGTSNGAPIKLPNGELLKDNSGAIVIPKLPQGALLGLAQHGRGVYQTIRNDNKDIETLVAHTFMNDKEKKKQQKANTQFGDQWQEAGPYLLLIVLPLLLGYFRRGILLAALPFSLMILPAPQAQADVWQDLWKTKDQQAQEKFNQQQYEQAAQQFSDPLWQGSAYYKAGDYEKALQAFQRAEKNNAQALYNQGNALAKLNKLEEAIKAYQQALAENPDLADAQKNKKLLEDLLKQQQQQENQQKNQQKNSQDKPQQGENKKPQDQKNQQQGKQQQSQQEQQEQQNSAQKEQGKQQQKPQAGQQNKDPQQKNSSDEKQQSAEQKQQRREQKQQQQSKAQQAQQKKDSHKNKENAAQAQQAQAKMTEKEKEMQQKHQQLLNKVTDDPYLLLRNKMQLEYQKRRHNNNRTGVEKSW